MFMHVIGIDKLVINVTAACGRGCVASVRLLVRMVKTEQRKGNRQKRTKWMGIKGDVRGGRRQS